MRRKMGKKKKAASRRPASMRAGRPSEGIHSPLNARLAADVADARTAASAMAMDEIVGMGIDEFE